MKTSRIAVFAFAAMVGIGSLVSARPAAAGSLDWLGNDNYVRCLKYVSALSQSAAPGQRDAAYDRGRRACNRQYYPNTPGVQH